MRRCFGRRKPHESQARTAHQSRRTHATGNSHSAGDAVHRVRRSGELLQFQMHILPDRPSRHDRGDRPLSGCDEARRLSENHRRPRRVREADQGAAHVQGRRAVPEQAPGRHGRLRQEVGTRRVHRHDHQRHVPVTRSRWPGAGSRHRQDQYLGRRHDARKPTSGLRVSNSTSRNSSKTSNGFTPTKAIAKSSSRFRPS